MTKQEYEMLQKRLTNKLCHNRSEEHTSELQSH